MFFYVIRGIVNVFGTDDNRFFRPGCFPISLEDGFYKNPRIYILIMPYMKQKPETETRYEYKYLFHINCLWQNFSFVFYSPMRNIGSISF